MVAGVGIRDLKAHLSDYLRRVQQGATVHVTHHGRTIAVIQPVKSPVEATWLTDMVAEGRLRWSGGKPLGVSRPHRPKTGAKTAAERVIEDRE
jgi:prevent-host-death family protein